MPKESNLTRKTTAATTDLVRMVVDGQSVDVTLANFATIISSSLSGIVKDQKVRTVSSSGAINATDNVILASGTITLTLPSPSGSWDATNSESPVITVAQSAASGTITINPNDSESIYDGGAQTSISLTNGSKASFVTNGTDWYVIGA